MVRSLIYRLTVLLLLAVSVRAELQLNPKPDEFILDGAKLKQLAFTDGGEKVTYQSPRGWSYSGSATQLTLRPPNKAQAEGTITRIPLSEPGKLDEESLKKLVAEAVALVPKGSTNVAVVSQDKSPVRINGKETFLVILSYNFYGENFGRSVLLLNRGKEQIRFQLTCRQPDFNELHRAFLASQFSWQNL